MLSLDNSPKKEKAGLLLRQIPSLAVTKRCDQKFVNNVTQACLEAEIMIEQWRRHYNETWPLSSMAIRSQRLLRNYVFEHKKDHFAINSLRLTP